MDKTEKLLEAENNIWLTEEIEKPEADPRLAYKSKEIEIEMLKHFWETIFADPWKRYVENSTNNTLNFLELAGGSGWATCILSDIINKSLPSDKQMTYITTDGAAAAVTKAKQVYKYYQENNPATKAQINKFEAVDVHELPYQDNTFDLVFISAALHHFPYPDQALKEIHRTLKPNGQFYVVGEPLVSTLMKPFYSYFGDGREREEKYGIQENTFTYSELMSYYQKARFSKIKFFANRETSFRSESKIRKIYYSMTSLLPDQFIMKNLMSSIVIQAAA